MATMLEIYGLSIIGSMFMGAALAVIGCHLAARDRAMQTVSLSQGALFGVLLGIGILQTFAGPEDGGSHFLNHALPLALALAGAMAALGAGELLAAGRHASRNTYYTALFMALLAACHLTSALFPALETHMARQFFGDLATLSEAECLLAAGIGAAGAAFLWHRHRAVSLGSFQAAILLLPASGRQGRRSRHELEFAVVALAVICFSMQTAGFLYTVACLFLPTAVLAKSSRPGLARHLLGAGAAAALGCGIGFLLSLYFTRLPTVPAMVAAIALISGGMLPALGHRGGAERV